MLLLRSNRNFLSIACVAVVVKLWLTAPIEINPYFSPNDGSNFLEHAKAVLLGQWFGPYDDLTLIKGPGMPLYLAAIRQFGIPLQLAHRLIYSLASLVACLAIRPLARRGWILGVVFCVVLFNPSTYADIAWELNRSQLIDTLALVVIASAIGIVIRSDASISVITPWLLLLGASTTAFCLTREDTIWILPPLTVFLVGFVLFTRSRVRRQLTARAALIAIPIAIFVILVEAVMSINGMVYGWNTTVETTAPEFVSAYQSFSRIVVPGRSDFREIPAPQEALQMAYGASRSAAELKPNFDPTHDWEVISCGRPGCDITAGFFLWALRDAVAGAGHYSSGANARAFYLKLSAELDAACDAHKFKCRAKSWSLSPPIYLSDVPVIAVDAAAGLWHAVTFDQFRIGGDDPSIISIDGDLSDYEQIVGFVAPTSIDFQVRKQGWRPYYAGLGVRSELLERLAGAYQKITPLLCVLFIILVRLRAYRCICRGLAYRMKMYFVIEAGILVALAGNCLLLRTVSAVSFNTLMGHREFEWVLGRNYLG
jgi:hypothetical protein